MKLRDVAKLLNKPVGEVEEMLKSDDTIALDLREKSQKRSEDSFKVEMV